MIRSRVLPFALALAVATAGCVDDDNVTGPPVVNPIDALVGSYTTQSFVYTSVANSELTIDLATIPPGLGITSLTVSADGTFTGSATLQVEGEFVQIATNGNLSDVTTTSFTINFVGEPAASVLPNPLPAAYSISGNVLSFTSTGVNFDFSIIVGPPPLATPSVLEVVLLKS